MSIKILIDTIIEMPDLAITKELIAELSNQDKLVFSDTKKLFHLVSILLRHQDKAIVLCAFTLISIFVKRLLSVYLENGWSSIGHTLVQMLGSEDGQLRKKSEETVILLVKATDNPTIYLQSIYRGFQNASPLRTLKLVQLVPKLLQLYPDTLNNQKSVQTVKLLIQKVVSLSNYKIANISKQARNTLVKLFHIKLESMQEVILRLDPQVSQELHKVWEKEIQAMQTNNVSGQQFRFEQLPVMGGKVFGIIDPVLVQRLLKCNNIQERNNLVVEFEVLFGENFDQLKKFAFHISKLLLQLMPIEQEQVVSMLLKLYKIPDIKNRVVIQESIPVLLGQLVSEKPTWRKTVRQCLKELQQIKILPFLTAYQKILTEDLISTSWFRTYEILLIYEQVICILTETSPPFLNNLVTILCRLVSHNSVKIRRLTINILALVVSSNQKYRDQISSNLDGGIMSMIQDQVERLLSAQDNEFLDRAGQQRAHQELYQMQKSKYKEFHKRQREQRESEQQP